MCRDATRPVLGPEGVLARQGATRLLVTHSVAILKHVDRIVVMRDGTTAETGTFQQLLDSQGLFAEFLRDHLLTDAEPETSAVAEAGTEFGLSAEISCAILVLGG